jgi:hypothetical protein
MCTVWLVDGILILYYIVCLYDCVFVNAKIIEVNYILQSYPTKRLLLNYNII